jgi:hypothetical protein
VTEPIVAVGARGETPRLAWLEKSLQAEHLLHDFAGGEIPIDAIKAARAEDAAHAAADLRADADRPAFAAAEEDALDLASVGKAEE